MLTKGYALAKTRRTSSEGLGEIITTLEDGSTVDYVAFNDTANYIKDFTDVAEKALQNRLGQAPRRTYFYGHSAGARIGRGINYTAGLNKGRDGQPMFDGILADDGAAGGWLPVLMKDGKDVLLTTDADKAAFVPQIDISHQMYNNIWPSKRPGLHVRQLSREQAEQRAHPAREGASHRTRSGCTRSGGSATRAANRFLTAGAATMQILDMSRLMERFIDMLDAWVDKGVAPPPTRSDWTVLGDVDGDGTIENPAVAVPDVACPARRLLPVSEQHSRYDVLCRSSPGKGLEPLDGNKVFVDMNRNGIWDFRETPTQAWQRLGLLKKGETLTSAAYVGCVQRTAEQLRKDGFFSDKTVAMVRGPGEEAQPSRRRHRRRRDENAQNGTLSSLRLCSPCRASPMTAGCQPSIRGPRSAASRRSRAWPRVHAGRRAAADARRLQATGRGGARRCHGASAGHPGRLSVVRGGCGRHGAERSRLDRREPVPGARLRPHREHAARR